MKKIIKITPKKVVIKPKPPVVKPVKMPKYA